MKARDIVLTIWLKCGKDWQATYDYIKNKKPMSQELIDETLAGVDTDAYVTIIDRDYPIEYKKPGYNRPPFVIERA